MPVACTVRVSLGTTVRVSLGTMHVSYGARGAWPLTPPRHPTRELARYSLTTVLQIEKEEKDLEKDSGSPREGPSRKESAVLNTLGKAQVSTGPNDPHWCK